MTKIRATLAAVLTLTVLATSATSASALSLGVKMACASDYYAHCSQHAVGSPGVRQCMRAVGTGLSRSCINALIAAGEVARSVVEKQVAEK